MIVAVNASRTSLRHIDEGLAARMLQKPPNSVLEVSYSVRIAAALEVGYVVSSRQLDS
jgi:hypothetical protein